MRLSHDQLVSVCDAAPVLISCVDRAYRYRMCNQAYASWFGLPCEEIVGQPVEALVGPEGWKLIRPHLDAALAGEVREFERDMPYRFGGCRRVRARYQPLYDEAGEVVGMTSCVTDLTARSLTEADLRRSEERYRSLFESIDQGFCVLEPIFDDAGALVDYRYLEANPAFEKHSGVRGAVGRRMREFFTEKESYWLKHYERVVRDGESVRFLSEREGTGRCFDVYAFLIGGTSGRNFAVLLNDVTHQKMSERALRESEARFRNMSDHLPVMLWVTDGAGICTHLNARWFEFTGQARDAGLGTGWLDAVHAEDRAEAKRRFFSANARRSEFRAEYRLRRHDGVFRWVIDAANPRFGDAGEYLGYIGSVIDIQERKDWEDALRRSGERFSLVTNGAQVGVWFCDLPFDVLEWDDRAKEHFWLSPQARVTIETFYERIHPADREPTRAAIAESISKRTNYDIEYRTVDPATGTEKWIRAIGRTFYDPQGQPIRFDGVTLDITERKRGENALREAKEQAERASRAKDEFLAQLSHELRTPLTPVLMTAAALMEDEKLPAYAREQLDMVARNIALEARLIDDLLDLTRITHGKLALRAESCDVHALLRLVFEIVGEEAREKRIGVALELGAQRSQLRGDPARLQQVFWNLLRNAVKFTPAGGQVRVRSFDCGPVTGDTREHRLCIEVVDNGMGFDPEIGEGLFEPFERGAARGDSRFPGLGLGLAIARAIVDLHGGRISAESAGVGRGATFTVELPRAQMPPASPSGGTNGHVSSAKADGPLRLLVVEDHAPTLEVLARLLRRSGHVVTPARNVAAALAAADKEEFDAVLSDLGLPDGTGTDLMEQLRARHGLSGVALSGYGTEEDIRRTMAAGFVAHLTKPVDMNQVRRVLRSFSPRPARA